jgi:LAO/AO transport system kinase
MWSTVEDRMLRRLRDDAGVQALLPQLERQVVDGTLTATRAAQQILDQLKV